MWNDYIDPVDSNLLLSMRLGRRRNILDFKVLYQHKSLYSNFNLSNKFGNLISASRSDIDGETVYIRGYNSLRPYRVIEKCYIDDIDAISKSNKILLMFREFNNRGCVVNNKEHFNLLNGTVDVVYEFEKLFFLKRGKIFNIKEQLIETSSVDIKFSTTKNHSVFRSGDNTLTISLINNENEVIPINTGLDSSDVKGDITRCLERLGKGSFKYKSKETWDSNSVLLELFKVEEEEDDA